MPPAIRAMTRFNVLNVAPARRNDAFQRQLSAMPVAPVIPFRAVAAVAVSPEQDEIWQLLEGLFYIEILAYQGI